jgi:hypothetical protein
MWALSQQLALRLILEAMAWRAEAGGSGCWHIDSLGRCDGIRLLIGALSELAQGSFEQGGIESGIKGQAKKRTAAPVHDASQIEPASSRSFFIVAGENVERQKKTLQASAKLSKPSATTAVRYIWKEKVRTEI